MPTFHPILRAEWPGHEPDALVETAVDGDELTVRLSDVEQPANQVRFVVQLAPVRELLAALLPPPLAHVTGLGSDLSPKTAPGSQDQ